MLTLGSVPWVFLSRRLTCDKLLWVIKCFKYCLAYPSTLRSASNLTATLTVSLLSDGSGSLLGLFDNNKNKHYSQRSNLSRSVLSKPLLFYENKLYFSVKIFLRFMIGSNPLANSSKPASVDQIWKKFAISSRMTSIMQDVTRKVMAPRPWGRVCISSFVLLVLEKMVENLTCFAKTKWRPRGSV